MPPIIKRARLLAVVIAAVCANDTHAAEKANKITVNTVAELSTDAHNAYLIAAYRATLYAAAIYTDKHVDGTPFGGGCEVSPGEVWARILRDKDKWGAEDAALVITGVTLQMCEVALGHALDTAR
jgi:hypothetical protein